MNERIRNFIFAIAILAAWATVSEMDARDYELAHGLIQVASK